MKEERDGRRVLKFWKNVLERCKERGYGWSIWRVLCYFGGFEQG